MSPAGAYGGGANHDMWQVGLSFNCNESYVDLIERTCSNHFKLLIDTGIFQTEPVDEGHPGFAGNFRPPHLEPLRCRRPICST